MNKKLTLWDTWEEMEDFQLPFGFFVALIFTLHTTWPDNSYLHLVSFQKMRVEKSWHFRWTRLTRIIISKIMPTLPYNTHWSINWWWYSNKVFQKADSSKQPARKRTIQTWQRKSSFCAEHYLKNFWMAPLLRQQHSSTIYKSVLSRCQTAFAFDFWSFALAFEKYANKLIKTALLSAPIPTPHTKNYNHLEYNIFAYLWTYMVN